MLTEVLLILSYAFLLQSVFYTIASAIVMYASLMICKREFSRSTTAILSEIDRVITRIERMK